jgi:2-keto-3-deoxy-L-rhamnonate aldolase RhmA
MKTAAIKALRKKLADGRPVFGIWATLESPSVTEMAVAAGLDWVVIDAEHGHLDWREIVEHVRAAVRRPHAQLVAGPKDADRDLAAIGNEQLGDLRHDVPSLPQKAAGA